MTIQTCGKIWHHPSSMNKHETIFASGSISIVPSMQERSKAERRATTGSAAGCDEVKPGGSRTAMKGGRSSHTANIFFRLGDFNSWLFWRVLLRFKKSRFLLE